MTELGIPETTAWATLADVLADSRQAPATSTRGPSPRTDLRCHLDAHEEAAKRSMIMRTFPLRAKGRHSEIGANMFRLNDHALVCPNCSDEMGTHLERVIVTARHEDGPAKHVSVDPHNGHIELESYAPVGPKVREGRRDRTSLIFSCEHGESFAVVFTQHKGETFVEAVPYEQDES